MSNLKFYFLVIKLFLKGIKVDDIQKLIEEYKLKKLMLDFRTNALLFGFDTSVYTDEEIFQMVGDASNQISQIGVTAEEAAKAFNTLAISMQNSNFSHE